MDAREVISKCGGPRQLAELLSGETGNEVKLATVRMWKFRNTIPWRWRVVIYAAAKKQGADLQELFKGK